MTSTSCFLCLTFQPFASPSKLQAKTPDFSISSPENASWPDRNSPTRRPPSPSPMRNQPNRIPLGQSPIVSPSARPPKPVSLFQAVTPTSSLQETSRLPLPTSTNAPAGEPAKAERTSGDEDAANEEDTSFLAISKSVRKSKMSEQNEFKDTSPKSSKSSFHSAQESPLLSTEKFTKLSVSLPNSSPILALDKEIINFVHEETPEEAKKPVQNSKSLNSPTSVNVPLKDESESTFGFARLPAREPFTKKSLGRVPSRERSWLDIKPPAALTSQNLDFESTPTDTNPIAGEAVPLPMLDSTTPLSPKPAEQPIQPAKQVTPKRIVSKSMIIDDDDIVVEKASVKDVVMAEAPLEALPELTSIKTDESNQLAATPSKGSLFRSKSKKEGHGTPTNLLSATFGAFRKAKKLLFEAHEEKDKRLGEAKSPSKHKLFPGTEYSIPRSPLRSPSRNKSPAPSPDRKERAALSPSRKIDPLSRLMAPTVSSSARQQEADVSSSAQKPLYPEIPKLLHDKPKYLQSARSPSPERTALHFESTATGRLRDESTKSTYGSEPLSPAKSIRILDKVSRPPSPAKLESTIASKTRSATANMNSLTADSIGTKYGVPTPSRVGVNKLTKQPLVKRLNTTTTPGPKQAPMPVRVPMTAHREAERKATASTKLATAKQALTSISLTKTKLATEDDKRKETAPDMFSTKFKAALSGKPGKEMENAKEKAPQTTYKSFATDSLATKRTSETAFGSPSERSSLSNGGPLRGPPIKKPSFGPSSSLMKNAIMHQAKNTISASSKAPYMDSVKFSSDKIKFGPSSATTAVTTGTTYQRTPSIISSASVSSKSSYASVNSHFNAPTGASQFQPLNSTSANQQPQSSHNINSTTASITPAPSKSTTVLPDIFSESEDDDDGSVILDWANSPELRSMLLRQQQVDPDSVFGPIAPLQMDEVFKSSRISRFRPRSSSANWSGQDKLSQQEIERYAKEMGYQDR